MISGDEFVGAAAASGVAFLSGVPCSLIGSVVRSAAEHPRLTYVSATSEGEATALAVGAWLAAARSGVLTQNSGLGNIVNPFTSLAWPTGAPLLILCSWRGSPGRPEEPQHVLMGEITQPMLELLGIGWQLLPETATELNACLPPLLAEMEEEGRSRAFLVPPGAVAPDDPDLPWPVQEAGPPGRCEGERVTPFASRTEVLRALLERMPEDTAVVATTGMTARELFELRDSPAHLYHVGAMGSAAATGLGIALNSRRKVAVIDGDGSSLMRLGTMATVGRQRPTNFVQVLLDNGVHDSTGAQPTAAPAVDFAAVAAACGFRRAIRVETLGHLADAFEAALAEDGPQLLHVPLRPGVAVTPGRPSLTPEEVADRFREFVAA